MDYVYTFCIGGIICVVGQLLLDLTKMTMPRILVTFVISGVVLQALHLYEPLVELSKHGATVPLTGFGYTLAKGAMEGAKEGFIGALIGPLKETAAGIVCSIVCGYIIALLCNPKTPK